uniref:Glycoside hydrolase family 3 N-terminal domain-containing protein n=1 Tax=Ananas comosus var. bracteatus TaxID=296719 RepID=A0A6V7PGI7_ANACO|nr:unnamed protein product [Ananas comosus var. bracteatus]
MVQVKLCVTSPVALASLIVSSVLNAGGSGPPLPASAASTFAANWADMVDTMQRWALSSRLSIPIIYSADAVHGHNNLFGPTIHSHNNLFGTTIFPHNVALDATKSTSNRSERILLPFQEELKICSQRENVDVFKTDVMLYHLLFNLYILLGLTMSCNTTEDSHSLIGGPLGEVLVSLSENSSSNSISFVQSENMQTGEWSNINFCELRRDQSELINSMFIVLNKPDVFNLFDA